MHAAAGVQGCCTQECVPLTQGSYGTGIWGELMLDLTDWQNKKYTNKDGTEAVILTIDAPGPQPIVGYVKHDSGNIIACCWDIFGHFYSDRRPSNMNLVNAKIKRVGWVNVFKLHERDYQTSGVFFSEEKADMQPVSAVWGADRIACIRIEWEE